jgi:antitoxin ParD1/3/4
MSTRSVLLSDQFERFITAGIEEGRYSDASEVIREGLRLLQQRDAENRARIDWLRGALQVGIDEIERGEGVEFASLDELAEHLDMIGDEASQELAAGRARG